MHIKTGSLFDLITDYVNLRRNGTVSLSYEPHQQPVHRNSKRIDCESASTLKRSTFISHHYGLLYYRSDDTRWTCISESLNTQLALLELRRERYHQARYWALGCFHTPSSRTRRGTLVETQRTWIIVKGHPPGTLLGLSISCGLPVVLY